MELWIARDASGELWLFDKKPILRNKNDNEYFTHSWFDMDDDGTFNYRIDMDCFPEVTFENSPQKVRLEIVKEED